MDLPDFLLARIAEDGENARGSGLVVKTFTREVAPGGMVAGIAVATYTLEQLKGAEPISDWVLHDERRVLAECEAKRRIVERARFMLGGPADDTVAEVLKAEWLTALRLLALPYADHPDYDEAWRP